jgi:hypothetical protein
MSSALPKAVQEQVKAANDYLASLKTPPSPPAGEKPATPPPAPPPDDTWQHKYAVLQGKYNAEVPRLQKTLNEQTDLIRDMRQRLTNTETMVAAARLAGPPAPPAPPPPSEDLAPEEVETYGEDLVNVMRRLARVEATKLVPAIVAPVADRVAKVEQGTSHVKETVARSNQQETLRLLAAAVPNWAELDKDQGFLAWLDKVDAFAGQKRGVLLRQAFVANDATRVIAFFQGYQKENAAVPPETPPSTPPAPPAEPQTRMEDLVAPGAPKAPTAGAPNDAKRVWTRKDVTSLYAAKNEYIRKGKPLPEELVKAEKDLFKAQHENRIQPG